MAAHKYTSWGRTRQPKNFNGGHGNKVIVLENANMLTASNPVNSSNVGVSYGTENQRYIHLYFSGSVAAKNKDVNVYGYVYAFDDWFQLNDTAGSSVTVAKSGLGTVYKVFEIAGVDRVAFVDPNSGGSDAVVAGDTMMAAGSTFQGS